MQSREACQSMINSIQNDGHTSKGIKRSSCEKYWYLKVWLAQYSNDDHKADNENNMSWVTENDDVNVQHGKFQERLSKRPNLCKFDA